MDSPMLDIVLHYTPMALLVIGIAIVGLRWVRSRWATWGWRQSLEHQAATRGVSPDHYLALVYGLVQSSTGLPDPLPALLVRRAICDEGYRSQLIDRTPLLPIRRFWRPETAGQAALVPPEVVLAQLCRRLFQPPIESDRETSVRHALAWQLAATTSATPSADEVRQIIWDRRYRATVLAAVDARQQTHTPVRHPRIGFGR